MKKSYLFLLLIVLSFTAQSQIVTIPDVNFKAKLLSATTTNEIAKDSNGNSIVIDVNNNGEIEVAEALAVYRLFDITVSAPPFKNAVTAMNLPAFTDLTGIAAFTNLTYLNVGGNALTTLDLSNNVALVYLNCYANNLTAINLSGLIHLETLNIGHNSFTTFSTDGLPALQSLNCSNNLLTSLTVNNSTQLNSLDYSFNSLTALNVSNLVNLKYYSCIANGITSLTISNLVNLKQLICSNNNLTALDITPFSQITKLICDHNQIGALDLSNAPLLESLACSYNALTSLDFTTNPNLKGIGCAYNQISTLTMGTNPLLTEFYGASNLFTQLDFSATGIQKLSCSDNPNLIFINIKNGYVSPDAIQEPMLPFLSYYFSLQNLPALQYICHDEGEIGSVEVAHDGLQNVSHGTYCSFAPGGSYNTITGAVSFDCAGTNAAFYNQKLSITNGAQTGYTYSGANGHYTFFTGTGSVTVAPQLENTAYFSVAPTNYTTTFSTLGNTETANFCLAPNGIHPDLEITVLPITTARPGFDAKYSIVYKNKGNQIQSGSVSLAFNDAVLDYVSANPSYSSTSSNLLTWDFIGLAPFESRTIQLTLHLNSPTDSPAVTIGDILSYTVALNTTAADDTPADNTMNYNQTVVGSFDPNDKTVVEGNIIGIDKVGEYLHYIVRFQNTGTAAAENVVIKDMLDANLDWSTLEMIASSHPYRSTLTSGNKLEVFYEGINLPASASDEEGSHGYIAFKIKPKSTIAISDVMANTAQIYFDFNFPITTNTVTTTVSALGTPVFNQGRLFTVYPNPTDSVLTITVTNEAPVRSITIYNLLGQKVLVAENAATINVSALSPGTYFVTVATDTASDSLRFIKQ